MSALNDVVLARPSRLLVANRGVCVSVAVAGRWMRAVTRFGVIGAACWILCLAASAAYGQVKITKVSGKMEGGFWVESVEIENTGTTNLIQWFVTSQPYNGDKWQYGEDPINKIPKAGENVADRQISGLDLEAGKKKTITFKYKKKYANFYADVYFALPLTVANRADGVIGRYLAKAVQPGQNFYASQFLFPFPNALAVAALGETQFGLEATGHELPAGWTVQGVEPASFALQSGQSQQLLAGFGAPPGGAVGDRAFVDLAIMADLPSEVLGLGNPRYLSLLAIEVVPEPSTVAFTLAGIALLWAAARRRAAAPRREPS